jgi:hypothetical protein
MGEKPSPTHEIERIDNDGGYHPGNCRWATRREQLANTRRCVNLTFRGRTQILTEWAREFIVVLVSAVALPTVLPALARRQVSEAARLLQGALVGARDRAIHDGRPSGIRLLPDPAWPLQYDATTGRLVPGQTLAYSRVIPIDPAPEYREGMVTVRPSAAYAAAVVNVPGLVLEEAPVDRNGAPNPPVSWMWNIRVGDRLQLNDAGPWYTVVGPMQVGPAAGNSEMFVNVGPPGRQARSIHPAIGRSIT